MSTNPLEYYLRPRSIAIVGASQKQGAIGNTTVKNLAELGYKGKVYCVNPRYEEIEGFPCFPSVLDIPEPVDVAVIAVPGNAVENAIRDCAEKKVSFALIFSAGFAEMGEEGLKKQNEILALCKESGIRVIGPNTMGTYNIKDKIGLTFSPASATKWLVGNVGLISQSGATGGTVLNIASEEEIGFNYVYTLGNQIDLTTIDLIDSMVEDEETEIIAAYMEAVPDGNQLKEVAAKALKKHKPLIVYKSGRSEAGQKAALSHTASLTGSNEAFKLVANRYGITYVDDIEAMVDAMKAFRSGKRIKGKRVATLVISGAVGIMVADKLSDINHKMAVLTEETKCRLKEVVPAYLSVENPVDIAATIQMNPLIYKHCIETLAEAKEVDALIVHLPLGTTMGGLKFAGDIIDVAKETEKPIIVVNTGTEEMMGGVRKFLTQNNVSAYNNVKSAVNALEYLSNYEKMYQTNMKSSEDFSTIIPANHLQPTNEATVTEPEVKRLLSELGIPVPRGGVGKNQEELLQIAATLNYPLAAKIVSLDITHKSDVGGVVLPIKNQVELREAYETITKNVKQNAPDAKNDGILIEELVQERFLETIVGITRDPVFGPIIMCGLGGIYVEVMKDVSQRLAPITEKEALEMIQQLKSYPLFTGIRKGAKYDVEAFAKILSEISKLSISLGDSWSEIEINPLIVLEEGKGVMALDGLITLKDTAKETVKL
jgi:acyl-CoA synthetase (NDP forming)